jgi:hypothetical protein
MKINGIEFELYFFRCVNCEKSIRVYSEGLIDSIESYCVDCKDFSVHKKFNSGVVKDE